MSTKKSITSPLKKNTTPPKTFAPKNGKNKATTTTQVYQPKVASPNVGAPKAASPTNNLPIVIGSGSNGSRITSTSVSGSKTSSSSSSTKSTSLGTTENKQVNKGKKVSIPKVVDIDYSVVENMKKVKANISIFLLSKISSQ